MSISNIAQLLYEELPQEILYHYTSLNGVMGIVKSRSLWATEVRFFNDTAELKHAVDFISSIIDHRLASRSENIELLTQFKRWLNDRIVNGHMLYVVCFTESGNLLSQWRGYSQAAKGVSLGFSPEKISMAAGEQFFQVGKCVYDLNIQEKLAVSILDEIQSVAKLKGENNNMFKRHPSESFYDVFFELELDILRIAVLLKHPAFHEEREWRVVSSAITNYIKSPIEYREGSSMLIPFMNFILPSAVDRTVDIERAYLGATPNINNAMTSLSMFLSKNNSSPREGVHYCQIPYRDW